VTSRCRARSGESGQGPEELLAEAEEGAAVRCKAKAEARLEAAKARITAKGMHRVRRLRSRASRANAPAAEACGPVA
jgi:hypothetical protein